MNDRSEDLWVELTQFDQRLADGVWDGTPPPSEAPAWSRELAALIDAAAGPPTPDELANEDAVVTAMRQAIRGVGPERHVAVADGADRVVELTPVPEGRSRRVGRIAAVKGGVVVGVIAFGVAAAAAATTGIVVARVAPGGDKNPPPTPAGPPITETLDEPASGAPWPTDQGTGAVSEDSEADGEPGDGNQPDQRAGASPSDDSSSTDEETGGLGSPETPSETTLPEEAGGAGEPDPAEPPDTTEGFPGNSGSRPTPTSPDPPRGRPTTTTTTWSPDGTPGPFAND
jgi:hypothetical protein